MKLYSDKQMRAMTLPAGFMFARHGDAWRIVPAMPLGKAERDSSHDAIINDQIQERRAEQTMADQVTIPASQESENKPEITIITNHQWRELISGFELSESERADFDWIDDVESDCGFFRYHGSVYHVAEFMRAPAGAFAGAWHGYMSDTYFSGILIRLADDGESVMVGRYYS